MTIDQKDLGTVDGFPDGVLVDPLEHYSIPDLIDEAIEQARAELAALIETEV